VPHAATLALGPGGIARSGPGVGWYWDPYFGAFTFFPAERIYYDPFGWGFYSPIVVYYSPFLYYRSLSSRIW
jgi:hypothetical protein